MKNYFLSTLILLFFIGLSAFESKESIQIIDDCTYYFPLEEGTSFEISNYDKKGKLSGINKHSIISNEKTADGVKIKATFEVYEKGEDEDFISKGDYSAKCEGGVFYFEMGGMSAASMQNQNAMKGMEMKMTADYLEIPSNPTVGQKLDDGNMTMEMTNESGKAMPMGKFEISITDRKVEGMESITTPAGTFECVKISQKTLSKVMIIKTQFSSVEWYSKGVGMVRSETYNKKGKLIGSSELTKFEK